MIEHEFVKAYPRYREAVYPSYLLESPYREILIAVARGDGKYYSAIKRARLSESVGERVVETLIGLGILRLEPSREAPLKIHPKQKLKRTLRTYRIQDKLRFVHPFLRFWFGFVAPYDQALQAEDQRQFVAHFTQHYERLRTLVYEQLCDALLVEHFKTRSPLISHGSYWDKEREFDILAVTKSKQIILGECKYKERKVCKSELTKLKTKALQSGIRVDTYALFSKSGFSNELLGMRDERLLLFDLEDLQQLCG